MGGAGVNSYLYTVCEGTIFTMISLEVEDFNILHSFIEVMRGCHTHLCTVC